MGAVRTYVLTFVLGFWSCATVARLVSPETASASSPAPKGQFALPSPAEVVARVGASVVNLEAYPASPEDRQERFLPRLIGLPAAAQQEPASVASGVVISPRGYVVTNNHVVDGAGRIRARFANGREVAARVVGTDPEADLAVLKIPTDHVTSAAMGDSKRVRAGDAVLAIGNPLGFENSVSLGIVSANRVGPFRVDGHTLGDMIQTDASINQGNSGGGLFSADGRLVGINTAIMSPRGGTGNIGIAFAIPAHRIRPVVESLIQRGKVARPWLGIRYHTPPLDSLSHRAPAGDGVLIEDVIPGSPAARAGLKPADLIRQLGDCPIRSADDIYRFTDRYHPGDEVSVWVRRGGGIEELKLTVGEKPA